MLVLTYWTLRLIRLIVVSQSWNDLFIDFISLHCYCISVYSYSLTDGDCKHRVVLMFEETEYLWWWWLPVNARRRRRLDWHKASCSAVCCRSVAVQVCSVVVVRAFLSTCCFVMSEHDICCSAVWPSLISSAVMSLSSEYSRVTCLCTTICLTHCWCLMGFDSLFCVYLHCCDDVMWCTSWVWKYVTWLCSSVARYHGTTAVPFFYGTSTVGFTVLFSTAIPQLPRFFGTVLSDVDTQ